MGWKLPSASRGSVPYYVGFPNMATCFLHARERVNNSSRMACTVYIRQSHSHIYLIAFDIFYGLMSSNVFMEGAGCWLLKIIYVIQWGEVFLRREHFSWELKCWGVSSEKMQDRDEEHSGKKGQKVGNVACPQTEKYYHNIVFCFCICFFHRSISCTNYLRIFNTYFIADSKFV